ncbi:MAG: class I SAM-dependent methyltransferase [Calditrichaeota bacterium]|nr:MAG: class I SAM-dependent methyltransferase [Calditrichota bacterium]MBL1205999.1 class I SAM-dependent methyltransferase [Calditrichota bacterium]NOG45827.1 methyltransferase domain-containing protein [Calditrichota bacterium]
MSNYSHVNYASLTIEDKNPIKRFLQNRRLNHGLKVLEDHSIESKINILDYGSGDGELSLRINRILPRSDINCYEPADYLRQQAVQKLSEKKQIEVISKTDGLENNSFDFIFCLEVFEHLPPKIIEKELLEFKRLLKPNGKLVLGIPNEIFFAALFKGALRFKRRNNDSDGSLKNIFLSAIGIPPKERLEVKFDGMPYFLRHMGFDYRVFTKQLLNHFSIEKRYGSPNLRLPIFLNFEVYLVCS